MNADLVCYDFVSNKNSLNATIMHRKAHLPSKICLCCHRPFTWRKKWQRCWEQVRYCSKRCAREYRGRKNQPED